MKIALILLNFLMANQYSHYEIGQWADIPKLVVGPVPNKSRRYLDLSNENIDEIYKKYSALSTQEAVISMVKKSTSTLLELSTTTTAGKNQDGIWLQQRFVYPYSHSEYKYIADLNFNGKYDRGIDVMEQRDKNRVVDFPVLPTGTTFYQLSETIWFEDPIAKGYPDSGAWIVWENWGEPYIPTTPVGLTGFLTIKNNKYATLLRWTNPTYDSNGDGIGDQQILDMFGGKFEILKTTSPYSTAKSTIVVPFPQESLFDDDITFGVTYYYSIRSADAYNPPQYSKSSPIIEVLPRLIKPLIVVFNLDTSKVSDTQKVFISGDFTKPLWNPGKIEMASAGGVWTLKISPDEPNILEGKLYEGQILFYRYIRTTSKGEEPEIDFPGFGLNTTSRWVVLKDVDGDGIIIINDTWNTPGVAQDTPGSLPPGGVAFKAEEVPTGINISLEMEPTKIFDYKEIIFQKSTSTIQQTFTKIYSLEISTQLTDNYITFTDTIVIQGATQYYQVYALKTDGQKTLPSEIISPGESYPKWGLLDDAKHIRNFSSHSSYKNGTVMLKWKAPPISRFFGTPTFYIVRYSTIVITDLFKLTPDNGSYLAGFFRAGGVDADELFITPNLGDDMPGYYFTVISVYGNWEKAVISPPTIGVASKIASTKKDEYVLKGMTSLAPPASPLLAPRLSQERLSKKLSPASELLNFIKNGVFIPQYSVEDTKLVMRIKNATEIDLDNNFNKDKLIQGFKKSQKAYNLKIPNYLYENGQLKLKDNPYLFNIESYNYKPDSELTQLYKSNQQPTKRPLVIGVPINDKNSDGILDETEGTAQPIQISNLRLYRLNEQTQVWERVTEGFNKVENKQVKAQVRHFSTFALMPLGNPQEDLSNVVIYPNPYVPFDEKMETGSPNEPIYFTNLTPNAEIFIYDLAGELVRRYKLSGLNDDEKIGLWRWDVKNDEGNEVVSGVYIAVIKDDTAKGVNKYVGKFSIVK